MIRYGSVCSGVEAASLAWEPLGWQPAWFAEIEPFPAAVLAHRWPHIVNHGDMTRIADAVLTGDIEAPDVLVGGTPCQAFSVAGLRGSLSDARGNLTLEFVRIFDAIDAVRRRGGKSPAVAVWENVPGVLNTHDNAFGCLLGALCGADGALQPAGGRWTDAGVVSDRRVVAWRILDAQYFGVPQRRRRVFVIAGVGAIDPTEILFERAGLRGHFEPRGTAWEDVAAAAAGSTYRMRGFGDYVSDDTGSTLKSRDHRDATDLVVVHGRQDPCVSDTAFALDCQHNGMTNVVCIHGNFSGGGGVGAIEDGTCYTLTTNASHAVSDGLQVRRLTPRECERLQGMPDDHTRIPWRGKPADDCPDGLRYKAIGNSMAVPVMRWIGERMRRSWVEEQVLGITPRRLAASGDDAVTEFHFVRGRHG